VRAETEGELLGGGTVDVEPVRVGVAAGVAVGGGDEEEQGVAGRDGLTVELGVGVTYRATAGAGGSNRRTSSTAAGISDGSSASSWRWPGCRASTDAIQPMSRPVVSFPAPAITVT
jgi:hypothetical protein